MSGGAISAGNASREILKGFRVLDFSFVMAGPFCSRLMADLGAEVIKIESSGGDQMRARPPLRDGASSYFAHLNCGKQSMVIDLKPPRGLELVRQLVQNVDVVIENFRPGVMERLGLDYAQLSQLNPRLVYCSISGFGQSGPLAEHPAYAPVIHAASGFDSVNQKYQQQERPPNCGIFVADELGGIYAFSAIQSALLHRERTGRGQYVDVDVAMMDAMLSMLVYEVQEAQFNGAPRFLFSPCRAADGFVMIAPTSDRNFEQICDAIGQPDWKADPRFARQRQREQNWSILMELLEGWTTQRSAAECEAHLLAQGVPCSRYNTVADLLHHPHYVARESFQKVSDASGDLLVTNPPFRFSDSPAHARLAVPALGEHTDGVLGELLGLDVEAVRLLRQEGVVA